MLTTLIGTGVVVLVAFLLANFGTRWMQSRTSDPRERYRRHQALLTGIVVAAVVLLVILWALPLQRTGTFLGLVGAGVAIALREPLLAIAGRLSILAGHIYSVGDRIEVDKISGDVIDIGFFYTRMLEIGNWIQGDQATGRIVQFSNSKIFGQQAVYNYTQNFSYIWDELMLPITYASDTAQAAQILKQAGEEYSHEFLRGAEVQIEKMKREYLLPDVDLSAQVYMKVTSNWVQLSLRYLVDPKRRRAASSFIWQRIFTRLQDHPDIAIGSDTQDITLRWGGGLLTAKLTASPEAATPEPHHEALQPNQSGEVQPSPDRAA